MSKKKKKNQWNNTEGPMGGGRKQWERKQTKTKRETFPRIGSHNHPTLMGLSSAQKNKWKEKATH